MLHQLRPGEAHHMPDLAGTADISGSDSRTMGNGKRVIPERHY